MMTTDRFTIADVARLHGLQQLRVVGGETYCVCPFCGDRRGKFSYIVEKGKKQNMFHCWKCENKGSAVDLHIMLYSATDYSGEDGYKNAVRDIFQALKGDEVLQEFHNRDIENINNNSTEETVRSSDLLCSRVYYAMLKELTLRPEHKADLTRRGLSDADIERFRFKSTPKDTKGLCRKLIASGHNLEGIPGFYLDNKGEWDLKLSAQGYFCPVYDGEMNYLLGFQISSDKARSKDPEIRKKSPKYLWLSSTGKEKGCSSGALTTFLPGKKDNIVIITEGILKATIIYCLLDKQISVIGVPGVNATKSLRSYLDRYSLGYFYEAFDMDKAVRYENLDLTVPKNKKTMEDTLRIGAAAANVRDMIEEEYKLPTHSLIWDFDKKDNKWNENFKGLDDFIHDNPSVKASLLSFLITKAEKQIELLKYFGSVS